MEGFCRDSRNYYSELSGTQESTCISGTYYLTNITDTNTYLLVVDDWTSLVMETRQGTEIGLNCLIAQT